MFNKKLNILVLGSNGMLGYEVYNTLLDLSQDKSKHIGQVIGLDVDAGIDVTEKHALGNYFMNSIHYDWCINCIAYTDTNKAQNTKEGFNLSYKLNALAPKYIAESCKYWKTKLIHVSTDYVFSEMSPDSVWNNNNSPLLFKEDSIPFPSNIYGYDKLIGEMNIREVFGKDSKDYCILRTSWLYSQHNNKSFIHKFLKNVVNQILNGKFKDDMTQNEVSIPTSCEFVINYILQVIDKKIYGIKHAVPICDSGVSRLEFANKILSWFNNIKINGFDISAFKLNGIDRNQYWPKWSVLKSSAVYSLTWDELLYKFLSKYGLSIIEWAKNQK